MVYAPRMLEHLTSYDHNGTYVPKIERVPFDGLKAPLTPEEAIRAAANAVKLLELEAGLKVEVTEESRIQSHAAFSGSKALPANVDPGAILHLRELLDEYDHDVVQDAAQLRKYVTNKLLEETDNRDPKVRLKALELLGKITEVGLFSERTIITIENKTDAELQEKLRENLAILLPQGDYHEVPAEAPAPEKSLVEAAEEAFSE